MKPSIDFKNIGRDNPDLAKITNLCSHEFNSRHGRDGTSVLPFLALFSEVVRFHSVSSRARKRELLREWPEKLHHISADTDLLLAGKNLFRVVHTFAPRLSHRHVYSLLSIVAGGNDFHESLQKFSDVMICSGRAEKLLDTAIKNWVQIERIKSRVEPVHFQEIRSLYFANIEIGREVQPREFIDLLPKHRLTEALYDAYEHTESLVGLREKEAPLIHALDVFEHLTECSQAMMEWSARTSQDPNLWNERIARIIAVRPSEVTNISQLIKRASILNDASPEMMEDCLAVLEDGWECESLRIAVDMFAEDRTKITSIPRGISNLPGYFENFSRLVGENKSFNSSMSPNEIRRELASLQEYIVAQAVHSEYLTAEQIGRLAVAVFERVHRHQMFGRSVVERFKDIVSLGAFNSGAAEGWTQYIDTFCTLLVSDEIQSYGIEPLKAQRLSAMLLRVAGPSEFMDGNVWKDVVSFCRGEWKVSDWDGTHARISAWMSCKTSAYKNAVREVLDFIARESEIDGVSGEQYRNSNFPLAEVERSSLVTALHTKGLKSFAEFLSYCRLLHLAGNPKNTELIAKSGVWRDLCSFVRGEWNLSDWKNGKARIESWFAAPVPKEKKYRKFFSSALEFIFSEHTDLRNFLSQTGVLKRVKNATPGNYRTALKVDSVGSAAKFLILLDELVNSAETLELRNAIVKYLNNGLRRDQEVSSQLSEYRLDSLPFALNDLRARQMLLEVGEVYQRGFELSRGFGAMTVEARRPLDGTDSLALQYAKSCFVSSGVLNAPDIESMPGPGILYSGLDLGRLLVKSEQYSDDPFAEYKIAWPWLAHQLDHLPLTKFLYARGLFAIIAPEESDYYLDNVHYSMVVYNDHFHNPVARSAYLVPTEILLSALKGRIVPLHKYQGAFDENYRSSAEAPLSLPELRAAAGERGLNVLSLGWVSNLGGLCNAYPAKSSPHHEWERKLSSHTVDGAGHVHKSHITGRYQIEMIPEMEVLLVPLRELHTSVYLAATRFFNLHDGFRLTRSIWHKGWDIHNEEGEIIDPDEFTTPDNSEEFSESLPNPMLRQAYAFHRDLLAGRRNPEEFPRLVLAHTLDYSSKPQSLFVLSTYDMTLETLNGEKVMFPPEGTGDGEGELAIWTKHVSPHLLTTSIDLRFYYPTEIRRED
jgi:hypothetical protein